MEFSNISPADYYQLTVPSHILEAKQQLSYFPPQWPGSPLNLGLSGQRGEFPAMQGQSLEVPASGAFGSHSSSEGSPCSSGSSRRQSQEDTPRQVG